MPIIKVWCLPKSNEEKLNILHKSIVQAVISVSEFGIKSERDMICLYPSDLMVYGLGEIIIIEISGLYKKPERTENISKQLAEKVGNAVKGLYPTSNVECLLSYFDPSQGYWKSS